MEQNEMEREQNSIEREQNSIEREQNSIEAEQPVLKVEDLFRALSNEKFKNEIFETPYEKAVLQLYLNGECIFCFQEPLKIICGKLEKSVSFFGEQYRPWLTRMKVNHNL